MAHEEITVDLTSDESAPGELPGLAALLRSWRTRAGQRLDLGKPLPQVELANRVGMSERWYRDLERGATARLDPRVLTLLADSLLLDADERATLYLYALGGTPYAALDKPDDASGLGQLQDLLDRQMPRPAYLTDSSWNIVGHNRAMAEWFPWVLAPDANLIRWGLILPEAREQLVDWPRHARMYLAMIRFALAEHPNDTGLVSLLQDVLRDPECRRLWAERLCVVANRDGHAFRLRLPHVSPDVVDVVTQVLIPAGRQSLRFVVIT
ncbi:transcriptional regulator with XRE-family HTH domain [Kitasatospora sp. MAA4]|uniref:helix-turn-helix transcriptional regulator n=1 Tax=Kitasatospora sp. MAA4 TaxID=3035093 RepID=UPI00247723B2|nr:helix-turn-helix transcriptional regulator [Kitasatospora sp. MAA4]MDH6132767.1 transcriptional regulator with XRE-family HTH domain [Kitasatospora sp. MAA4]